MYTYMHMVCEDGEKVIARAPTIHVLRVECQHVIKLSFAPASS